MPNEEYLTPQDQKLKEALTNLRKRFVLGELRYNEERECMSLIDEDGEILIDYIEVDAWMAVKIGKGWYPAELRMDVDFDPTPAYYFEPEPIDEPQVNWELDILPLVRNDRLDGVKARVYCPNHREHREEDK